MNKAVILLGSNIQPGTNLHKAVQLLSQHVRILKFSSVWKSKSIGYDGPDFLNAAVLILTNQNQIELNQNILKNIEDSLGRKRSANKNAPRTIDLDIEIFNDQEVNPKFWEYAYSVFPISEILPNLLHPIAKIPINDWTRGKFSNEGILNLGPFEKLAEFATD